MELENGNLKYDNEYCFDNDDNKKIFEEYIKTLSEEYTNYCNELRQENENEEQILKRLTKQFIFLNNKRLLTTNDDEGENEITIAKRNNISIIIDTIRDYARNLNLEEKLSLKITKQNILPIHHVLLKHGMHYFQYLDYINLLYKLYKDVNFYDDDDLKNLFNPHKLFFTYNNREMLKMLILTKYLDVSGNKKKDKAIEKEARKIDTYMNTYEEVFF